MSRILESIRQSIDTKQKILNNPDLLQIIENVASVCTEAFCNGNKVLFCGNGCLLYTSPSPRD